MVATTLTLARALRQPRRLDLRAMVGLPLMLAAAVPGSELSSLVGRQLAEPVHADQVLAQAQLSARAAVPAGQVVVTVPFGADNAVGGRLNPGDVVQVLATTNAGKDGSRTSVILQQSTVYDVGREDQGGVVSTTNSQTENTGATWAALIVTPDQAVQLANARWNGNLDIALVPSQG